MDLLTLPFLLVFPALMAFAAASDLVTMTISNWISLALVVAFAVLAPFAGIPLGDIGLHAAVGAGVLALTFAMFAFGWIGGGDAKLAAAVALWFGTAHGLEFALHTAVYGGVLTLGLLTFRRFPLPLFALRHGWVTRLHDRATGVPYGIAIAAGALMVYPETPFFAAFA